MTSALDALAAALVQRWTVLPTLAALELQSKAPVVRRGAPVGGLGDATALVLVEFDATPEARENARFEQEWLDLACTRRRELGELLCTAVAQTGDDDIAAMESHAFALLAACVDDLKSDLTVGGVVWSQHVVNGSAQQFKNERGVAVIVPFTIAYAAGV